jgi:hypothetical protein
MYHAVVIINSVGVLGFVHAQDVHDHLVDDLGLAIYFRVEGSGLGDLGAQQ